MLALFTLSCNRKQEKSVNEFDKTIELSVADSLFSDKDLPMGTISSMKSWNDVLITCHHTDDYRYSFIDRETGKLITRWGQIGNAPNEFIDFGSEFFVQDSLLVFQSSMKKLINYVSIPAILRSEKDVLVKTEDYPYTADFRPLRIAPIGNKKVATGLFKQGILGVLDENNNIIGTYSDYPFPCEVEGLYRGTAYQLIMSCNAYRQRLLVTVSHSDVFEIYGLDTNGLNRVYVDNFNQVPVVQMQDGRLSMDDSKTIAGIMELFNTDDLIYLGYSHLSLKEAALSDYTFDEILCFDWDGNKVKKYKIPFSISTFCVIDDSVYVACQQGNNMTIYRLKSK
jgi:hypothetical protein